MKVFSMWREKKHEKTEGVRDDGGGGALNIAPPSIVGWLFEWR
jgi:hypothetical protein